MEFPECEKLSSVSEESNKIGAFLDWLINDRELVIAEWAENDLGVEMLFRVPLRIEQLLAEYYDIDLDKVEQERRSILGMINKGTSDEWGFVE